MTLELRKAVLLGGKRVSLEDMGVMLLPQHYVPRNATRIDHDVNPVIAAGAVDAIAFQYQVPEYRQGVLRRLAVEPLDPAAIPSITFSIKRSGAPVHDYQNVQTPIGTVGVPDEVYVEFDRQQLLQITVSNSSGFPYDVHVRVIAWFWMYVEVSGR